MDLVQCVFSWVSNIGHKERLFKDSILLILYLGFGWSPVDIKRVFCWTTRESIVRINMFAGQVS